VDIQIRPTREDEFDQFARTIAAAFSDHAEPEDIDRERSIGDLDRCLAAYDGSEMVGGTAALTFRMAVPGGSAPTAGVTAVGVKPTHRRRGINTALMRRQLDDIRERSEPLAILYASEGGIYGRFGYGLASLACSIDIATDRSGFIRGYVPSGRMRMLERAEALARFREVYDRVWAERPGGVELTPTWFEYRFSLTHFGEKRIYLYAAHETAGELDGYAVYRVKHDWSSDPGPDNELQVDEVQAFSPQAYADVWRYLLDVDLIARVTAGNRPVDEPLLHLMREPRRLGLRIRDGLWLRLVDVRAALAARRYATEGRLVLDVRDPFCPKNEGRYLLEGTPSGASCEATKDRVDLTVTVNELGATFLGGTSFRQLVRAGRVTEERPGSLALADSMFGWDPAPWCPVFF
jgi:predicted acetyltransferase